MRSISPERFRQIEELYHTAREGTLEQRRALLAQTETELRRLVEMLLSERIDGEFLDRPAIQNAAELLAESTRSGLAVGATLGPYRIEGKLGEGGMGEVFRAVDSRLDRPIAIKIMREQFGERFEREARAIAALNHPNICTLHDVGPNYLVMEFIEGDTLAERLKSGPLSEGAALLYASQILAALAEAHARGIVHRDLKPANIMIAKSGIKVLDFGLAKSGQDDNVTTSRLVMGTPAYMAPEQKEAKPADARSDIYSFGCVLYEMVTGASVGSQRRRIPSRKLAIIADRCLEEDPGRRWHSVADLQRQLAGVTATGNRTKFMLGAAAATLGLSATAYFYFPRAPRLTDKDTIVLADFVNKTDDAIFDGTLREGLAIQLEQSPFLKIMDDEQMQRVLGLMSLPSTAPITSLIAREICVREAAVAAIDGTITSLGKAYVITLQAVTCQGGVTLAREQIQAEDKEHVLKALGAIGTAMRSKLELHNSIQKLNSPLEQVTTPSLKALQNYTMGHHEIEQGHFLASVPLFKRAIAIDPNFAMADHYLSIAFENAEDGDMVRAREYAEQAFGLIDHVSEFERSYIVARHFALTGELDKAIDAYQLGIRNYPRFWGFHNYLSMAYLDMGRYEEGLKEALEAARLDANTEHPYRRQLDAYICLDRLAEARQLAEKLRSLRLDGARIHQRFLEMAYVQDDAAAIASETKWFAGKPEEYISFDLQAAYRNLHGQRHESRKFYERAAETALRQGFHYTASYFEEADAQEDALLGNCRSARRLGRPALALAVCGDSAEAEKLAAEASRLFPNGKIWNSVQLPEIRAAIALNRNQPARSVELLVSASPYGVSYLDAVYLRGLAYLRLHRGAEAAAEFGRIVDHKGANWYTRADTRGQFYSLSYLGMARSFALEGETAKAKRAFEDFFELWKHADPDIPILQQAKSEFAKLR